MKGALKVWMCELPSVTVSVPVEGALENVTAPDTENCELEVQLDEVAVKLSMLQFGFIIAQSVEPAPEPEFDWVNVILLGTLA